MIMLKIYNTDITSGEFSRIDTYEVGSWVNLVNPTEAEIDEVLNQNYKENLINNINIFCKNINCSSCGGTYNYQTFTCEYCGSFNKELKRSYDTISSLIPSLNKDNIDKELTLYLYNLTNSSNIFNHVLERFDLAKDTKNIIKELETSCEYNDLARLDNPLREIEGEIVNINDLFADFIKDKTALFYKYPQLNYEFKEENGSIVYKSKNELVDEMIFQNKDTNMEEFYLSLIKNANDRESFKDKSDTLKN